MTDTRYADRGEAQNPGASALEDDGPGGEAMAAEEALARIGRGDDAAFGWLLQTYRSRIYGFVRRCLDRDLWADDVTQEVFVQVHRSASRFSGRSSAETWLFGLALNVCRNHRRAEIRPRLRIGAVPVEELDEIADTALDPLELMERDEREARVREAVAALPVPQRLALHLRDWEGMSYAEIAEVTNVPVGTVRSRLHNARVALADRLAALMEE